MQNQAKIAEVVKQRNILFTQSLMLLTFSRFCLPSTLGVTTKACHLFISDSGILGLHYRQHHYHYY